jgi:hypothetical protein
MKLLENHFMASKIFVLQKSLLLLNVLLFAYLFGYNFTFKMFFAIHVCKKALTDMTFVTILTANDHKLLVTN